MQTRLFRSGLIICVSLVLLSGGITAVRGLEANLSVLRIGFLSSTVAADVNTDDVLAAAKVWVAKIGGSSWKNADSYVFADIDKAKEFLEKGQVDIVAIGSHEYLQYPKKFPAQPYLTYEQNGQITVEYVLLVQKDSLIESAKDLEGKRVALNNRGRDCLAPIWLETYLLRNRPPGKEISLRERRFVAKANQAILPVFFRQIDAAVVIRSAFETAVALNPQVGKQLRILATSPPLVPTMLCLRDSLDPAQRELIISRGLKIHETPEGQQTFTTFRIDRIVGWQKVFEPNIRQLLDDYERLKKSS